MELPNLNSLIERAFPLFALACLLILGYALDQWGQVIRDRKNRSLSGR